MKLQLAQILTLAPSCLAQVALGPPSGQHYSSVPLETLSTNATSVNIVPYQSNASLYYLGYEGNDWERPFSKYWNPVLNPISDELQKGITESPYASRLTFSPQEAHDYFTRPGYLQLENGWAVGDDGVLMLAIRTDMGDVTGDIYKLWHPLAHQYAWRYPNVADWANKTLPQRYIGSYSFIDEFIGNFAAKLTVNFVEPESIGFDTNAFDSQGIETIVVGHITNEHVTNVTGNSYLMHKIRRKENEQRELRSRFFLEQFTEDQPHHLGVHCGVEMSHLATFLPQLYAEFKDTV
ncbi:phloretin hydrolase [Fusarium albosuccineum]|uniref:Phloretin hydrolase n=1 Tax=Fusarium albosuccineum TaxID=1237068 RepID=A0A8H4L140_9HYPO|nr:phloretin hydrolase [Fusarium albosuccineum]